MKKAIKRKTTVKKFATGGTKSPTPKSWAPTMTTKQMIEKVGNSTKSNASKDKWGRPSTSKWYGFNPNTKKFEADKKGDPIRANFDKKPSGDPVREGFKTATSKTTVSPKKDEVKTTTKTTTTKPIANTVSALWKEVTGTPWSDAKGLGLTDGSAASNLALMKELKSGDFTIAKRREADNKKDLDRVMSGTTSARLTPKKAEELPGPARELATYKNGGIKKKTTVKKATPVKRKVVAKKATPKKVVKKATPTRKPVSKKVTVKKFDKGGKKTGTQPVAKPKVRGAEEDPNYVNLMKRLNPTKPKVRGAEQDPNYVNLMKKMKEYKNGGTKGTKKVVKKVTKKK